MQTIHKLYIEPYIATRETKRLRDGGGGGSTLGWQVHTCHTGAQRDEESKRQRAKDERTAFLKH